MKKIILHIDVNNAFLSWLAVEMLKNGNKIDIRNRYAVIGGDEDSRRGVVLAKSNLCKAKGVITGESLYMARRKCPYLDVYKGDRKIYEYYSNLMYEYLLKYTNIIERYSIDECFLDYTYSINLFGDPIKLAYKIKEDIIVSTTTEGIEKNNYVISIDGLVGVVDKIYKNNIVVKLLTSKDFLLQVQINDCYGILKNGVISGIDNYCEISLEDEIYTSNLGYMDEQIKVGYVNEVLVDSNKISDSYIIRYANNFNDLNYVLILTKGEL